ncbi:hypothetical protein AURDEDRAFT_176516 [Auricularia subglabra TFB-10046 SS5]|uniref:Uncharacterized protein n=1 Tax=Auricularia subglabra (strain TFB-10046 / SS5) TaxID=717982 RepID=J0LD30_AURST|nr:hypothetical protein AURDEDRAFT_176516 [Auricularia subglabra TFB-10046 SS5]
MSGEQHRTGSARWKGCDIGEPEPEPGEGGAGNAARSASDDVDMDDVTVINEGEPSSLPEKDTLPPGSRCYAVANGRVPRVYRAWWGQCVPQRLTIPALALTGRIWISDSACVQVDGFVEYDPAQDMATDDGDAPRFSPAAEKPEDRPLGSPSEGLLPGHVARGAWPPGDRNDAPTPELTSNSDNSPVSAASLFSNFSLYTRALNDVAAQQGDANVDKGNSHKGDIITRPSVTNVTHPVEDRSAGAPGEEDRVQSDQTEDRARFVRGSTPTTTSPGSGAGTSTPPSRESQTSASAVHHEDRRPASVLFPLAPATGQDEYEDWMDELPADVLSQFAASALSLSAAHSASNITDTKSTASEDGAYLDSVSAWMDDIPTDELDGLDVRPGVCDVLGDATGEADDSGWIDDLSTQELDVIDGLNL